MQKLIKNLLLVLITGFQFIFVGSLFADVFVISRSTANIREFPTTESEIIEQAHKNDWFIYLGSNGTNKWRKIELSDGRNGWVYYTLGRVQGQYISTDFEIDKLEIHVINVQQGDCTLIVAVGKNGEKQALLFDAGKL